MQCYALQFFREHREIYQYFFCVMLLGEKLFNNSFQDKFFLLELKNGFLRLMYDFGFSGGPIVMESNLPKLQINDARYHEVNLNQPIVFLSAGVCLLRCECNQFPFNSRPNPI
jgi:hypothetical protein